MRLINDGYVGENNRYWIRNCKQLGTYLKCKDTWKIVKTHLSCHERIEYIRGKVD